MADLEAPAAAQAAQASRADGADSPLRSVLVQGKDPVLMALDDARDHYLELTGDLARQAVEAQAAAARLEEENGRLREERAQAEKEAQRAAQLDEEVRRLRQESAARQDELRRQAQRAERQKERARLLADALKDIHRAILSGDVFDLILRACLQITGATRGLYLTVRDDRAPRVRAAVEVDGYPGRPPSAFVTALCRRALQQSDTLVWNNNRVPQGLPAPHEGEHFHNAIVAPVVLLKNLNGIVLIADKLHGEFDAEDADAVLSVGDQAAVAVENQRLQHELGRAYLAVVGVLADAIEVKDPYTSGHCEQVAWYARRVALRLGLSDKDRALVSYAALLHDVGKIGVSDGILNKPGRLLPEEWKLMCTHVRVGRDLVGRVPALARVAEVVLHHHEAYDGSGYPEGLKGEQIPLASRIVAVADAYCAMISKRSYKESYSQERAREELIRCRGKQFDPAVVDALLAVLDEPAPPPEEAEDADPFEPLPGFIRADDLHGILAPPKRPPGKA